MSGEPHIRPHQATEILHGAATVASLLDVAGVTKVWVPSTAMSASIGATEVAASTAGIHAWSHADAVTHRVKGTFFMPPGWTTATFTVVWANAGAGSGDVRWQLDYGPADAAVNTTAALPGTLVAGTGTAGAANILVHTALGSAVAVDDDKPTIFLVDRLGTDGADTLTNAAWLHGILVTKAS